MDKVRILFTTSENYDSSIERDIAITIGLLDRARFECAVACPEGAPVDNFRRAGAATFRVDMPTKYDPRPIFRLSKVIGRYRPDIVHAHTTRAALFSALAARRSEAIVIQTEHLWTDDLAAAPSDDQPRFATKLGQRMLTRGMISLVIVYSQASADFHLDFQRLDPAKLKMIYYCVEPPPDIDAFAVAAKRLELGIAPEALVVSNFGRHDLVKGLAYLVAAAPAVLARHPNAVFCFFGDGKQRGDLERQARELGVREHVIFAGWRTDVFDMMAMTDVVVSPSLSESAGRIVMEAMASARPLVVSDAGALPEYVGDESVARIVPPMDPDALAEAINNLLDDPELRRKMGAAGRARYDERFRPSRFVRDLEQVYLEVMESRSAPGPRA